MQYSILDVQTIKTRYGHRFKQFQCIYILERSKITHYLIILYDLSVDVESDAMLGRGNQRRW